MIAMSTHRNYTDGNVGVRIQPKRGRDICLWRTFTDGGGTTREFTLYLTTEEADRLFNCLADCLDAMEAVNDPAPNSSR